MDQGDGVPELTSAEQQLLPLLATPLSLDEIADLLELPRAEVQEGAIAIYRKLGIAPSGCT